MVRFAHLADCHLGGWRQEELRKLNLESFTKVIDSCISEKVDFILISGDLFDSAYPSIEILKDSFAEFKKVKDARIPVYIIAGSHDFSASGKTFLDVLEKAGFCKNVENWEIDGEGRIKLKPTMHGDIAIYGYPGRKSGMEVEDLRKVYFDSIYAFTIFMVHSTIKDVVGTIPMDSIEKEKLPLANYYALGHIHKRFEARSRNSCWVYPGPTYPNNFQELVDLGCGSFQIVQVDRGGIETINLKVPSKEVIYVKVSIDNGFTATQQIITELDRINLKDKIVLLKLFGTLIQGKTGDIRFAEIEDFIIKKGAYVTLRSISSLKVNEEEFTTEISAEDSMENMEKIIQEEYSLSNPAEFNKYLPRLMNVLSLEKNEDERSAVFEERLVSELKTVLEMGRGF
ncbi:MAG: exonuclease SbcCD subunit D [archaeon]|nr:exonuclease SbcCD subunit D [archaeon]MCR4324035.1 exonuclease SbcCD subunit D [Nanoarchaeota archaeon]